MGKRPLIALLTNDLVGTYQYSFWSGMKAAASVEDCDLVSFNGGAIDSPDQNKRMRNACFDLVSAARPDGMVVLSTIFNDIADVDRIRAVLARFSPTPLVTVGFTITGYPSILVDNRSGMTDLVEHLIVEHRRTGFAFLGGTSSSPDSIERREALVETLARHGMQLPLALDVDAGFDFGLACEATRKMLDSETRFDTLVAANDTMALGAMEVLRERGKRIPDDVVVTGFDDIEDGLWIPPSLTTVHQSVFQQGEMAIRLVVDGIDDQPVEPVTRVSSVPIFRGSCGCASLALAASRRSLQPVRAGRETKGEFASAGHMRAALVQCESSLPSQRFSSLLKDLLDAISSDCRSGGNEATRLQFEYLMDVAKTSTDSLDRWQILISNLRAATLPYLPQDPEFTMSFDGLLHLLRVVAHERAFQQMGLQALQAQQGARDVHIVGQSLVTCREIEEITTILAEEAANLKITSLHLLLRDEKSVEESLRLHLSVQQGHRRTPTESGQILSKVEIVKRVVGGRPFRSAFVVEPLYFGRTQLGFAFFELASRRGMLLDSLRGLISAAIVGTRLGDQLSHREFLEEDAEPSQDG